MYNISKFALSAVIFALTAIQVNGLSKDWMGINTGATFCKPLDKVANNGFDPKGKMDKFRRVSAASVLDVRPRWSTSLPEIHGIFTILLANRDSSGNLQHHLKIHSYARNWVGYLVIKATYVAENNGPHIDHYFAYDLEDSNGCVLSTESARHLYNVDWSYQLTGHLMKMDSE